MTKDDLTLKASLIKKISEWMDDNCDKTEWPSVYLHPESDTQMADAAYAVFKAMYQSQAYAEEQG